MAKRFYLYPATPDIHLTLGQIYFKIEVEVDDLGYLFFSSGIEYPKSTSKIMLI